MIGRNQILKLAKAGKPLHCVEWDFGPERPDGMGGLCVNHFATRAQAQADMDSSWKSTVPTRYYTRPVSSEERAGAQSDWFYIIM